MFYIYTNHPEQGDWMNCYEWDELEEMFGDKMANDLANGITIFANGAIHVNAAHAAVREATDHLCNA